MPFYYDTHRETTTNGSGSTESQHLRFQSAANQESARIVALYGSCIFGTAGGAKLRIKTASSIGSGGTSQTPAKRNPNNPAAGLTAFNDATALTAGTGTVTERLAIGMAQTGGMGAWVALEPSAGISLLPNGGANGNAEVWSEANAASVPIDITVEHAEGA